MPRRNLPQTSQARLHFESPQLFETVLSEIVDRMGSRPDQTHVAFKDVPELGNFIKTVLAQDLSNSCNPRIIANLKARTLPLVLCAERILQAVCGNNHGAQLVAKEYP